MTALYTFALLALLAMTTAPVITVVRPMVLDNFAAIAAAFHKEAQS